MDTHPRASELDAPAVIRWLFEGFHRCCCCIHPPARHREAQRTLSSGESWRKIPSGTAVFCAIYGSEPVTSCARTAALQVRASHLDYRGSKRRTCSKRRARGIHGLGNAWKYIYMSIIWFSPINNIYFNIRLYILFSVNNIYYYYRGIHGLGNAWKYDPFNIYIYEYNMISPINNIYFNIRLYILFSVNNIYFYYRGIHGLGNGCKYDLFNIYIYKYNMIFSHFVEFFVIFTSC